MRNKLLWFRVSVVVVVFGLLFGGCKENETAPTGGEGGEGLLEGAIRYTGPFPATASIAYTSKVGDSLLHTNAYAGFVRIFVDPAGAFGAVMAAIQASGGTVVAMTPTIGHYLVQVTVGQEAAFLSALYPNSWVQDGSPAGPVIPGALAVYDFFSFSSNPTGCGADHGDLVKRIAERRGGNVAAIDLATDVQPSKGRVEHTDIARDVVGLMESDYKNGFRRVFNFSLQGAAIGSGDKTGCSTQACRTVRHQQIQLFHALLSGMEAAYLKNPAVANNAMFTLIAGNSGLDLDAELAALKNRFPNAWKRVIMVGGSTPGGAIDAGWNHLADNSSGNLVYGLATDVTIDNSATCSGTSYAGPEVASVLDFIWSRAPGLTSEQILNAFNQALINHGTKIVPQDANGFTTWAFISEVLALAGVSTTPPTFTLSVSSAGTGTGTVSASPTGLTYPAGTVVSVTATPNPGSTFTGWSSACSGTGSCTVIMNANKAVTATFTLSEEFRGTFSGVMGNATSLEGCGFAVSVSGTITLTLAQNVDGTISGSASVPTAFEIAVTSTPPNTTCTGSSFSVIATGTVSGTNTNLTGTFQDDFLARPTTIDFMGTRSGNLITGSATVTKTFRFSGTSGESFETLSATFSNITLTKQ